MIEFSKDWSIIDKISHLQRRILIYSIMYYEENESIVTDAEYEEINKQLLELMKIATEKEMKKTTYYYCMSDYDGSTGFDLKSKLKKKDKNYLDILISHLLDKHHKKGK